MAEESVQPEVQDVNQEAPKTGEIDKLFNVVSSKGLYTKSKDEFIQKYSTPESVDKLFQVVSDKGLYTKSKGDFYSKYYPNLSSQKNTEQVGGLTAYSDSRQKTIPTEEIKRPSKLTDYTSAPLEMVSKAKATEVSRKPSTQPVRKIATEEKAAAEGTSTNLQLPTTLKGGQFGIVAEPQQEGELQQKLQKREDDKQTAIKNSLLNQGIKPNTQQYLQKERDLNNQLSNDNLVVDKDNSGEPKLFRSEGFAETLGKTIYNSFKAPIDAYDVNKISDPNQFVQKMNEQTEEESSKPSKILGSGAELIGGVVKPISLLALNAVAGGMGTTAMVAEAYYSALANEKRKLYIAGKQQGLSDVDAAKKAMDVATYTALPDAAMAFVMSGELGNLPKTVPAVADNTFKNALIKSGKSVLKIAALGGASEIGKIGVESLGGYKETLPNAIGRVWGSTAEWGKMDLGFRIIGGIIPAAGYLKAAAKNWLKNVPEELIQLKSEQYGDAGEKIKQSIADYKNAASNVEGYVPDEHLASFAGKIEKSNKLQDDITQKQLDKIGKPEFVQNKIDEEISDIQKQIDGINKEVNTAAKKGVEPKEIDDATGIEAGVEPKINVEPIKTETKLEKQAPEVQQPTETQKPTVEAITEVKPTTEKTETKTIEEVTPVVEEVKPTIAKEEVKPVKEVYDRNDTPINIDDIGEGFVLHRGGQEVLDKGFHSIDKIGAEGYAGDEGKTTSSTIKKDAKILKLVSGDSENYSDNAKDIDEFYRIIGEKERKKGSEWATGENPSDITTRLWDNKSAQEKLKKAGVDIVIGNTIDGVDAFVVNKDALEPISKPKSETPKEQVNAVAKNKTKKVKDNDNEQVIETVKSLLQVIKSAEARLSEYPKEASMQINEAIGLLKPFLDLLPESEKKSQLKQLTGTYPQLEGAKEQLKPKEEKTTADTVHDDLLTHLGIIEEPKGETKPAKKYTSKNIDTITEEGLNDTQKKVVKDVKNVVKAVSKLVEKTTGNPLEVNIHETPSSYEKAVIDAGGTKQDSTTKGFYLDADGTIHLNMERVTTDTMLHEGFHPVLDYMAKNRPDIIDNLHSQLEGLKGGKEVIDNANKLYEGSDATTIKKEAITDFIAKVADGTIKIDKTNFQKVKDFFVNAVNKLGFELGKDINTITDLKKLAELVSEKFTKGEEIEIKNGSKANSSERVQFQSDFKHQESGIEWKYFKNSKEFKKLVDDGYVTFDKNIDDFKGAVVLHAPDAGFSGQILKDGQLIANGKGGMYYPMVFHENGDFWAATSRGASKLAETLNEARKKSPDGKVRMVLISAPIDKLMSSSLNGIGLVDILTSKAFSEKSGITPEQLRKAIIKGIKTTEKLKNENKDGMKPSQKPLPKITGNETMADLHIKLKDFYPAENSDFPVRKSLNQNILEGIASYSSSPKVAKQLAEFLGAGTFNEKLKSTGGKLSRANLTQGFSNILAEPTLRGEQSGKMYAIIELGADVKPVKTSEHESYPYTLRSTDANEKPTIHILSQRDYWYNHVNDENGNSIASNKEKQASMLPASAGISSVVNLNPTKTEGVSPLAEKAKPQFSREENENEDIVSASVNVAPLYSTRVDSPEQAALLQNSEFYKEFKNKNEKLAGYFNLKVDNQKDGIGGFAGVSEVTTVVNVTGKFEDIVKYAAINGSLTPEVQESTIAGMYVEKGSKYHNADKIEVGINDMKAAMRAVKDAGFDENGYTLLNDEISFFNIHEFKIDGFEEKINIFESKYKEYGGQITREDYHAVRSEYIDAERRKAIISKIDGEGLQREQDRTGLRNELENAKERNENFLNWKKINESDAAIEYRDLRQKQLELADKGESLSDKDDARIKELEGKLSEPLASIISSDKKQYEKAKKEIDTIANDVASLVAGGFKSEFGIKRPSRAAVKVVRWYDVQPNLLADGARANVIVNTNADADFLFNEIKRRFNSTLNRNEGETTNLGYPKRLIELRTKSGKIAEIQVMTPQGYLAKDGISHFPEDAKSKAKESLKEVRNKLGWDIPDGVGHYFYEIHRDPNVPKSLKIQAEELSNKYYKAFLDSESKLTDSEFRKDITNFKDKVDAANKSKWDNGNEGKSPKTLDKYLEQPILENKQQFSKEDQDSKIKDFIEIQRQKGISDKDIQAGLEKASEKIGIDKAKIDELMSTPKVKEKGDLQSQYDSIKSEKAKKKFITKNFGEVSDEQLSDIVKNNTDLQTIKDKIDAIQKSGAGEVLQRKQEGDGSQGGKRGGMEQGEQGNETTTEKNGEENGNGQRVGISHKSLTELADKLGLEQPQTGDVLTPEEYSERGKLLIKNGADPIKAAEEFKKDNKVNSDIISVARAHFNELIRDANDARIKFGIGSEEYKKSIKEANDWAKNVVKPMGTAFGEIGRSLQGQVDLDTGNFVSVSMAVQEKTGKDLSTEQTKEVERLTKNVSDLNNKIQDLEKKLTDTISKGEKTEPKAKEGIKEKSKEIANVIRKGKLSRPDIFSSASPASLVWDAAVEITAKTVEVSGDIAQAIADGLEHIKNSDWYKNSDSDKQKAAQKAFRDFVQNQDIKIKFAEKKDNKFTTEEAKSIWEYAKEEYLDKGSDYREMLNGVSKDLGLNRDQVRTAISQPKGAKEITDEMYRNINKRNNAINEAKQWVEEQGNSKIKNFRKSIPSAFFKLKTFGHGTVGGITHAGTNIFQPSKWKSYLPFFAKQFKYAFGDTAKYEMAMEDLKNDPQFTFWQRAGLAVDPKIKYDDYQGNYVDAEGKINGIKKLFNRLGVTGDRGFNALKVYRLDLAKGFYDRLSNEEKADPNTAKEIAKLVNHSTGTSELDLGRGRISKIVNTTFFAPKLEASRWQGLIGDPVKAAKTFTNWKEASPAEKAGAKLVARNAGEKIATYVALLAANSALLSLMGSKQKINYTNPLSSDWLKFKTGGGKTLDVTGGTLASMKLLGTLLDNTVIGYTGNKKQLWKKPAEKDYQTILTQARYKLSPFASTIADIVETTDAMGRPLPYSHVKPKKGETQYTIGSYIVQQQAPIPVSAGVREAIGSMKERGMTNLQIEDVLMGTLYFTVEGFTGAKLGNEPKKKK